MPFESKAQWKMFRAKEARGELPKGTASRWAHETKKGYRSLPEHKGKKSKGRRHGRKSGR